MELIFEQDMTGLKQVVVPITGRHLLHIELDGISHNYGAYERCVIRPSSDGGSTFLNPVLSIGANATAAQEQKLLVTMKLTPNGNGSLESCVDAVWTGPVHQINSEVKYALDYGVEIDAFEFRTNSNRTFDGGTLRVYADCLCPAT